MVQIAVLGHGVVGSGVVELLQKNREEIEKKSGISFAVKRILDLRDFSHLPYGDRFTNDFSDILNDKEITVIAEAMGGISPAYEFTKKALLAGKSVVTSNKELVAAKGAELLAIAREQQVNFLFEASVGGGIPVIHPLYQCLCANRIDRIAGILNGTTNYILTKMETEKADYEETLKTAQKLGYAERDPSADVDGHDACRKICILASLAFGNHIYPETVYTEGIRNIAPEDILLAGTAGYRIKLLGYAALTENNNMNVAVRPMLVSKEHLLANINDVFNGVLIHGDAVGETLFYGRGAGKEATASAVVSDVIEAASRKGNCPFVYWEDSQNNRLTDGGEQFGSFYFRADLSTERLLSILPDARKISAEGKTAWIISSISEKELEERLSQHLFIKLKLFS